MSFLKTLEETMIQVDRDRTQVFLLMSLSVQTSETGLFFCYHHAAQVLVLNLSITLCKCVCRYYENKNTCIKMDKENKMECQALQI